VYFGRKILEVIMMKTKFPEGLNFEKTKNLLKKLLFCLFEPEKQKYIKSRRTKVVRNLKTHFFKIKVSEKNQ
jgi:hypothetical protein